MSHAEWKRSRSRSRSSGQLVLLCNRRTRSPEGGLVCRRARTLRGPVWGQRSPGKSGSVHTDAKRRQQPNLATVISIEIWGSILDYFFINHTLRPGTLARRSPFRNSCQPAELLSEVNSLHRITSPLSERAREAETAECAGGGPLLLSRGLRGPERQTQKYRDDGGAQRRNGRF